MTMPFTRACGPLAGSCLAACLALAAPAAPAQNFIGVGAAYVPEYEGSDEYEFKPVPLVRYERGNFFISRVAGAPALGLRWQLGGPWSGGVFAGLQDGRDADDYDRLKGLDDIDWHGVGGAFLRWSQGPLGFSVAYRQALKSGYGGILALDADYRLYQRGRSTVTLGVGTQWASSDAMDTYFGVSQRESQRSRAGLRPYEASSGFKSATVAATWTYGFDNGISTIATLGARTLLGDARDSPVTERRGGAFGMVGLSYAF
ncbi:MipA/OmpV family protein [Orrella sp. JC864]|uniref:MipA/OmpV family protein n=1 Tax=Orrella sp. JC864 TaxID=3120298 RepID=UPI00300A536E